MFARLCIIIIVIIIVIYILYVYVYIYIYPNVGATQYGSVFYHNLRELNEASQLVTLLLHLDRIRV